MSSFQFCDLTFVRSGEWPMGNPCLICRSLPQGARGESVWARRDRFKGTTLMHHKCMIELISSGKTSHTDDELESARLRSVEQLAKELTWHDHEKAKSVNILQEMINDGVA